MNTEKIKKLIYNTLDEDKNGFNTTNERTKILNVEHSIGKYHAYMELLADLNIGEFIKVSGNTKHQIEKMTNFVENIYKLN